MPVFQLTDALQFPPCEYAEPDGLLAVGGDLSTERLLLAYRLGIFPWYSEPTPILWWSPDPRLVLFPDELKVSKSLRRVLKKECFSVTFDRAFSQVIMNCGRVRQEQGEGTWITRRMAEAYTRLHQLGYAHSVESWQGDTLIGGLYGVALGGAFFGESMFSRKADASKVALVSLVRLLRKWGFELIDCQVATAHLMSFGAREIPRSRFLEILKEVRDRDGFRGSWTALAAEAQSVGAGNEGEHG